MRSSRLSSSRGQRCCLPHWINRESFLATSAFFGIYLGRGRPFRSQVFTLELFPGGHYTSGTRVSADKLWGRGISEKTVWHVVKKTAISMKIPQALTA